MLADALQILQPQPEVALVFGSLARGEENAGSDIDLLLIGDCTFGEAVKALYPAQEQLQREINPVIVIAAELARRNKDTFIRNILDGQKLFVIGTCHDLGKLAGDPSPAKL